MATRLRRLCLVAIALAMALERSEAQTIAVIDDAKLPRFEVASVKPGDPNSTWGSFGVPRGRFSQENADLFSALMLAFDVRPYQVAMPLPDLITRERFTINAKMPPEAAPLDLRLMVRALLIDRFKLRYHVDRSETDGYALTVARASKEDLPPLPGGAAECGVRNGPGSIDFGGMPIDMLINVLSNQAGAPVVNQTGLTGNFDAKLRFALASAGPPPPNAPPPSAAIDDAPSLFTAVQEQLGLKLTPAKVPLDRLVIDHIERTDPD